jgi:hypothetical protein
MVFLDNNRKGYRKNNIIRSNKMGITTIADIFDNMLSSIDYPKDSPAGQLYPFKVRCGVVKRRPPRHEFFQYIVDMGKENIERVLEHQPLIEEVLTFVFPERWMNVKEQNEFMAIISTHPNVEKIKRVDVLTSSPILIGSFRAKQIRILTWGDDKDGSEFLVRNSSKTLVSSHSGH